MVTLDDPTSVKNLYGQYSEIVFILYYLSARARAHTHTHTRTHAHTHTYTHTPTYSTQPDTISSGYAKHAGNVEQGLFPYIGLYCAVDRSFQY